jgi:hypothetical protein
MTPKQQVDRLEICTKILLDQVHMVQGRRLGRMSKMGICSLSDQIHAVTQEWKEELSTPPVKAEETPTDE